MLVCGLFCGGLVNDFGGDYGIDIFEDFLVVLVVEVMLKLVRVGWLYFVMRMFVGLML